MKAILLCIGISMCNVLCYGQIDIRNYFFGDNVLNKGYGTFENSPYNEDTSVVIGYTLPQSIGEMKGISLAFLYKSQKDSLPLQIMTYFNGEANGFQLKMDDKFGEISIIQQEPLGVSYSIIKRRIIESSNIHSHEHHSNFRIVLDVNTINLTVKIGASEYKLLIDYNLSFIRAMNISANEQQYSLLWARGQ